METLIIRKPYDPAPRVRYHSEMESMTEQHHKAECETTRIVERYLKTGVVDHLNTRQPITQPITGLDYKTAMDIVAHGKSSFEQLPAKARKAFDNDPANFLAFINDPKNAEKAIELGLATPLPAMPKKTQETAKQEDSGGESQESSE